MFQTPYDQTMVQQTLANYNTDIMRKYRGTLSRVRRKAMLSKDPRQLAAYFSLAESLGINPGFSAVGNQPQQMLAAQTRAMQQQQLANLYAQPALPQAVPQIPSAPAAPAPAAPQAYGQGYQLPIPQIPSMTADALPDWMYDDNLPWRN